jgi:hypothetical protein
MLKQQPENHYLIGSFFLQLAKGKKRATPHIDWKGYDALWEDAQSRTPAGAR